MRTIVKRFFAYIPWLIYQIIMANFHVARLVLSPKMPINPKIIKFKVKLDSDISLVTFANSITLTPGTITVDIKEGEFCVHALDETVAYDLLFGGKMEDRIAHIYMEAEHVYVQDVLDVARIYGALK
jgi:multicomponent Na+:H+ antiporter subunit E